jgi:hypothetical protein
MNSPVESLLPLLHRVRQTGPDRYSASCPGPLHAHGDRSPSLSIAIGSDDRVLLRCFAGCDVASILAAVGMEFSDLFPPRAVGHARPVPGPQRPRISDRDLLSIVRSELEIIALAGEELQNGPLCKNDMARLRQATNRINAVLQIGVRS